MQDLCQEQKNRVTLNSLCKLFLLLYLIFRSVHNQDENDFKVIPFEGVDTILKCFKMQVKRLPNEWWLGTRDFSKDPTGPYAWKTWKEVNEIMENYAKGMHKLNLLPIIENEG